MSSQATPSLHSGPQFPHIKAPTRRFRRTHQTPHLKACCGNGLLSQIEDEMAHTPALRIALYFALSIFSIVLLGLTGAEIHQTLKFSFYRPIVVELLVTSCLTILWSWFIMHTIHSVRIRGPVTTFRDEAIGFLIIWIMYLIGTAIATNFWANLGYCSYLLDCRLLSAIVAFAWLNFITTTLLAFTTILFLARNSTSGGIREPLHGRWGTDATTSGITGNGMTQARV